MPADIRKSKIQNKGLKHSIISYLKTPFCVQLILMEGCGLCARGNKINIPGRKHWIPIIEAIGPCKIMYVHNLFLIIPNWAQLKWIVNEPMEEKYLIKKKDKNGTFIWSVIYTGPRNVWKPFSVASPKAPCWAAQSIWEASLLVLERLTGLTC